MHYLSFWWPWNVIAIPLIYGDSIVKATLFETGLGVRTHNSWSKSIFCPSHSPNRKLNGKKLTEFFRDWGFWCLPLLSGGSTVQFSREDSWAPWPNFVFFQVTNKTCQSTAMSQGVFSLFSIICSSNLYHFYQEAFSDVPPSLIPNKLS